METHRRSIAKAVSWRIGGTLTTALIALVVTGKLDMMVKIGLADLLLKVVVYYVHERLWVRIPFGKIKSKSDDYEI